MAFFPKVKIVILGFIMATALLPRTVIFAQPVTVIRVAIEDNIYSLNIRIRGGYTIRDSKTNAVYYEGTDINATATTYPSFFRRYSREMTMLGSSSTTRTR